MWKYSTYSQSPVACSCSIKERFNYFYFMCMSVLHVCIHVHLYVHHAHVVPTEEGIISPRAEVLDSCEVPLGARNGTQVLCKNSKCSLRTDPSLQPNL